MDASTFDGLFWFLLVACLAWHALLFAEVRRRTYLALIASIPAISCQILAIVAIAWWTYGVAEMPDGPGTTVWLETQPGTSVLAFSFLGCVMQLGIVVAAAGSAPPRVRPVNTIDLSRLGRVAPALVAAGYAGLVVYVVSFGVGNLIDRATYINVYAIPSLSSYSGILFLATMLLATITTLAPGVAGKLGWVLLIVLGIVAFATASRIFALVPLGYLLTRVLFRPGTSRFRLVVAGALAVVFFAISLASRGSTDGHGLLPYIRNLRQPVTYVASGMVQTVEDLIISVPLLQAVKSTGLATWSTLLTSLSPMPSSDAAWKTLAPVLRLHAFIPFSGFGEVYSLGPVVFAVFGMLFGFLAGAAVMSLAAQFGTAGALIGAAPTLYAYILLLEYNTRASSKVLDVVLVLAVGSLLVRVARRPPRATNHTLGRSVLRPRRLGST